MIIGISVFELHLHASRSLKDKRRVVKSLIERIHHRFRVSIAETGFHDLHQRAEIALAVVVAGGEAELDRMMEEIHGIVESDPEVYLTRWDPQILEGVDDGPEDLQDDMPEDER
jgi:uncharacterized protein YlxP (DUF503 family)